MKFMKIKCIALTILLVSGLNILNVSGAATDSVKAKLQPKLGFSYLKNSDGSKSLICKVKVSSNDKDVPLKEVTLKFLTGNDLSVNLGNGITDFKGKVDYKIPVKYALTTNEEGKYSFKVEFAGNDTVEAATEEVKIIDATMEMTCNDADSIKTITVRAYKKDNGKIIPLKDEKIAFYIPRMFSMLQIAEAKLDSAGFATIEFPTGLTGDSIGNLTIIARFEGNSDFGYIEKTEIKKWGIATTEELLLEQRALWTAVAPVWMIVTLAIMLVGVWAHYLYVIIHMVIINNKGKNHHIIR